MTICVSGESPKNNFGYNPYYEQWQAVKDRIKVILKEQKCDTVICGMALGIEQISATAVLELKKEGYNINLTCILPYKNFGDNWDVSNVNYMKKILAKADKYFTLTDKEYSFVVTDYHAKYMAKNCDTIIYLCKDKYKTDNSFYKYALENKKDIIYLTNDEFERKEKKKIVLSDDLDAIRNYKYRM